MERIKFIGSLIIVAALMIIGVIFIVLAKLIKMTGIIISKLIRIVGLSIMLQWDKVVYEIQCEDLKEEWDYLISI